MDLVGALDGMLRDIENALPFALQDAGEVVADEAKTNHPYQNRTGRLEKRTRMQGVRGSIRAGYTVTIVGDTKYGAYVEFGTSRNRAYPFLRPAWEVKQGEVVRIVEGAMERMLA